MKQTEKISFFKRAKSMMNADARRLFVSPLLYILIGIAFAVPILILVMTSMTATKESGAGFDNVWQIIGSLPLAPSAMGGTGATGAENAAGGMDMLAMCNINLLFFAAAVLVCLFVCEDFRSGYAKNIFTVRAKKTEYVLSKTLLCWLGGALTFIAFFLGALVGGGVAGLSFAMDGFHIGNLVCCMLAKIALLPLFIALFTLMSVLAKQRTWLALCLSLGASMLLFMMIPMLTPLTATALHVFGCLAGGAIFAVGLGAISVVVLNKTSLV